MNSLQDSLAILTANARNLERERLAAHLERETFDPSQGRDDHERGYREGWNARGRDLVARLRSGT